MKLSRLWQAGTKVSFNIGGTPQKSSILYFKSNLWIKKGFSFFLTSNSVVKLIKESSGFGLFVLTKISSGTSNWAESEAHEGPGQPM